MAVPSYTTDIQTVSLADAEGTWVEIPSRKSGGAATLEDRAYIQGSFSISQSTGTATGKTAGLQFDYGGNLSWATGYVVLMWQYWQAPYAVDTWANGGMRIGIGSGSGDVNLWNAQGNDYGRMPYGGFTNVAIDPTFSPDEEVGSAVAGQYRYFWSAPNMLLAVSKGNPHCVDAIRFGRGSLVVSGGEVDNYAIFSEMAAENDANSWGLFQAEGIGYLWKGLISLGVEDGNLVDFRDSNVNITIDDTPRTYESFNRIEAHNASSNIEWTGINVASVQPSGLSIGQFEMMDNATLDFDTCVFTDMNTFIFDTNATIHGTTFRRCNQVTQGGGDFDDCTFSDSISAVSLYVSNLDNVDACAFESNGLNHAIELSSAHAGNSYTLTDCTYSEYASADGSTGNECIYNNSGGAVTINIIGGDTPTVRNGAAASTTLVINPVVLQLTVTDIDTTLPISAARCLVLVSDGVNFPYNASVNITGTGTTATVAHAGHGYSTGENVNIQGASPDVYNGAYTITVTTSAAYTYTTSETIASSPATGTITATTALINDITNASGVASDTRSYNNNQPITGKVRKSSVSPYYKQTPVSNTVDKTTGKSINIQMISDE